MGLDATDQRLLDDELVTLDGTDGKRRLGANAILGVSLAVAKAAADEAELPLYRYVGGANAHVLPVPFMNVLNGGAHADSNVDVQEFMLAPVGAASFAEALRWGVETYHALKALLHDRGLSTALGDEGGFAPEPPVERGGARAAARARSRRAGYTPGDEIALALDVAVHRVLHATAATCSRARAPTYSSTEWADRLVELCDRYPIVSIEDGMAEDDWDGWRALTERLGARVQLVGDDLFVTNVDRLAAGHRARRRQLDPDQGQPDRHAVGDARHDASSRARHGYTAMMSHRSGETEDTTIADLAVATNCGQIKTGAPARSDRVAKYNQLLRIEEELGPVAAYLGRAGVGARRHRWLRSRSRRGSRAAQAGAQAGADARERPAKRGAARSRGAKPGEAEDRRRRKPPSGRRKATVRAALFRVVLVGLLFAFVYPTRTFLDQRADTNRARAQLELLRSGERSGSRRRRSGCRATAEIERSRARSTGSCNPESVRS